MKQFNLNTPKNLPKPSPVFTIQQVYSPFMSPYAFPLDLGHPSQRRHEDDELDNFSLGKRNQEEQPHEQEPAVEQPTYANNDSDEQPEEHRQTKPACHDSKVRYDLLRCRKLVQILVSNVDKSDERLNQQRLRCISADDHELKEVYDILVKKFKKLKKTKEEMTKYCMRKAFKFLSEKIKRENPSLNKEADVGLKHYFLGFENDDNFTIPFKKNSHEKTMNTNFLKKVFSSQLFLTDYMEFLKSFRRLVEEDNTKKIKYLAETIESHLAQHSTKKLETIKRLPWTQNILEKTQDLAQKLAQHSPYQAQGVKREPMIQSEQQHRNFFAMTPTLRSSSPPRLNDELPHKKVKLQH